MIAPRILVVLIITVAIHHLLLVGLYRHVVVVVRVIATQEQTRHTGGRE